MAYLPFLSNQRASRYSILDSRFFSPTSIEHLASSYGGPLMKTDKVNRRQFLKTVACTAVSAIGYPYIVPSSVLGANGAVPPSEKIVMGFVGVGSMGSGHLRAFLGYTDVPAILLAGCRLRSSGNISPKGQEQSQSTLWR